MLLEPSLRGYLEYGDLFAGDVDGTLVWLLEHLGEWWYGPILGPAFTEAVLWNWEQLDPTRYVAPIA